jgi:DNA polymerase-3 subunit epsilon
VDNTRRELHGALLDAGILVDVYLAMTGGQSALALDTSAGQEARQRAPAGAARRRHQALGPRGDADELRQHEAMLELIHKASGGKALWRRRLRAMPQ